MNIKFISLKNMPYLKLFLIPISILYGLIVSFRNMLFDFNVIKSKKYDVPIISIGNLCVGGSGKSPMVEYIVKLLSDFSDVAVLSRGYGRVTSGFHWVKLSSCVRDVGDEPLQIKRKFPNVLVAVSENRQKGIKKLLVHKCQVVILDDGYQHRWVKPGLSILLTTYDNLFINDYLLPYGSLRESRKRADRADIIVVTKSPKPLLPLDEYRLKEQIAPSLNQKLCFSYIDYKAPQMMFDSSTTNLINKKIILVTAISSSKQIVDYVKEKADLVKHFEYRDHKFFKKKDVLKIIKSYTQINSEEKLILTTEKDASRLAVFENEFKTISFAYLPIEVKFQGNINFNELIINYAGKNKNNHQISITKNAVCS